MARATSGSRLRVGTFLAPNIVPVYQAITDELGLRLGIDTQLVVETDYECCRRDVNDICFICSLSYMSFERQGIAPAVPIAPPVLKGARYSGRPIYFSDVIVARESSFHNFQDLRGQSWAYNERLSQSGYGITRYHLVKLGETHGFFSEVVNAGFHEEAIKMVAEGRVAGSAIDSQVLAVAMRHDPALPRAIRIVGALGPSTIQPVVVLKRLSP
jgi:phosphonate transport system substrate-binding protein